MYQGRTHHFKIFKKSDVSDIIEENEILMGDSGYQKMHNYRQSIILKKKPRRGILSRDDIRRNKTISKYRVKVEHTFEKMKKFRILRNKWNGKLSNQELLEKIIELVAIIANINIEMN